jgi:hypothetical protein
VGVVRATDPAGASATTSFRWSVHPAADEALTVRVDVLVPCPCRPRLPLVPVVVYGTQQVSGSDVDLSTVRLDGFPVAKVLRRYVGVVHDVDGDGFKDVVIAIDTRDGRLPAAGTLTLTGQVKDGNVIEGNDDRCTV